MGRLSLAQIEMVARIAAAQGLDSATIEGLRMMLLQRSAQPGNGQKLQIAIDLIPDDRAEPIQEYLQASTTLGNAIIARGAAALNAISDDEWNDLVNEEAPDGSEEEE